jgi:predicted phage terminase large subunit-like protein
MLESQLLEAVRKGLSLNIVKRELARRRHYEFIKQLWVGADKFVEGQHIAIICDRIDRAIEDFEGGKSSFLVIKMPFRHSKSTLISRFLPPHFIGRFPDKEVMVATYSASLCRTFSRFSRNIMRSEEYQRIYPGVELSSEEQSVDVWGIHKHQGKVHWLGIGGSITGKGGSCFPAGTMIQTEIGEIDIAELHKMDKRPRVLAYNHATNQCEWKCVVASNKRTSDELAIIQTRKGNRIASTINHLYYIKGRGYCRADALCPGDTIVAVVPYLRKRKKQAQTENVHGVLSNNTKENSCFKMRFLWQGFSSAIVQSYKILKIKMQRVLLLNRMRKESSRNKKCEKMYCVQYPNARETRRQILQYEMQEIGAPKTNECLPRMRNNNKPGFIADKILFKRMRQQRAFEKNEGAKQFALQARGQQDKVVFGPPPINIGAGSESVRNLWDAGNDKNYLGSGEECDKDKFGCSPHRRRLHEQRPIKLNNGVLSMPYDYPQVENDSVSLVERTRDRKHEVYDIQVEGCHNFFANGILVHNCIIIDDFFKGREEAASENVREKVWDSIVNEILTRRTDPCIVIVLATPWHLDDPFGRIAAQMEINRDFPRFEELKFPAKDSSYPSGYLWPEKFGPDWYESQFATLGPYYASALLQCEPTPRTGNMFRIDKARYYKSPPEDITFTRGWDLASSEKSRVSNDPDYTVGIRLGVRWIASGVEGQAIPILYIDDMIRGRWEALQRKNIIRDAAIADGEINLGVESFGAYKDAYTEMAQILSGLRVVKRIQLPGDKVSKWAPLEAAFAAGNVYLREGVWNQDFIAEFSVAPDGKHDDIIDALSVAFSLHNPYIKQIWPSFSTSHSIKMDIQWDKAGPYTTAHIGALALQKDMSLCFLSGLWDDKEQKLYVYNSLSWVNNNQSDVIEKLVGAMKLDKYRLDKLIGSENMFSANGWEHSVARQLNRQIKDRNLSEATTVREPIHFNFFGAIQQGEELFRQNCIYLNDQLVEVSRQWKSWIVQKGKPSDEDCGFCECLCLILSELQRKKKILLEIQKPKDYIKIIEKNY